MSKNVRISLYILIPIILWVISGQFIEEDVKEVKKDSGDITVVTKIASSEFYAPRISLNASATSEKRVLVLAKTSG